MLIERIGRPCVKPHRIGYRKTEGSSVFIDVSRFISEAEDLFLLLSRDKMAASFSVLVPEVVSQIAPVLKKQLPVFRITDFQIFQENSDFSGTDRKPDNTFLHIGFRRFRFETVHRQFIPSALRHSVIRTNRKSRKNTLPVPIERDPNHVLQKIDSGMVVFRRKMVRGFIMVCYPEQMIELHTPLRFLLRKTCSGSVSIHPVFPSSFRFC